MEALKCLVAKVCIFTLFYRSIVTILKINLLFGIVGSCKKPDLQLRKVTWHLITGVEKKNDDLRRYFHRKINRWDAATNLLLVEKRQEELREEERAKQPYEKRDSLYWMDGGKQKAAKKVARISTSILSATPTPQAMTESVLKKKKVPDLITLLEQRTGKKMNPKSRKQDLINALLSSDTQPRFE